MIKQEAEKNMSDKCEVFDIIATLVKSFKTPDDNGKPYVVSKYKGKDKYLWNCNYLLNQILRNYDVPPERYHVSKAAKELWDSITDKNIRDYYYHQKVVNEKLDEVEIIEFKGSSKNGTKRTMHKGDSFVYRDVFHNEHVIPISMIIDELVNLPNPDEYDALEKVLDKIHVCRMLKIEDRGIPSIYKNKRPDSFEEVIKEVYEKSEPKIEIVK